MSRTSSNLTPSTVVVLTLVFDIFSSWLVFEIFSTWLPRNECWAVAHESRDATARIDRVNWIAILVETGNDQLVSKIFLFDQALEPKRIRMCRVVFCYVVFSCVELCIVELC